MKTCKQCGASKPESDFYRLPHTADGLNYRCIPCQNAYNRDYNARKAMGALDQVVLSTFQGAPDARRLIRFVRKIKRTDNGCWHWRGNIHPDTGYGRAYPEPGNYKLAHRISYEWAIGPIPDGLTIDHLCKVRHCVNPAHLEAVTRGENTLRGDGAASLNQRKTHCKYGHPFSEDNTYLHKAGRVCKTCSAIKAQYKRAIRLGRACKITRSQGSA